MSGDRPGSIDKRYMNFLRSLHRLLARETVSTRFIAEIDGLRFIAIATVFLQHLQQQVSTLFGPTAQESWAHRIETWHFGVELFFLISGFVLGMPFAVAARTSATPPSLRQYYLRRLTRIEPPYVFAMLGFFVLLVACGRGLFSDLLPHLLAGLAYVHQAFYHEHNPINPVTWSLEVEVQFYLLAPLLFSSLYGGRRGIRRLRMLALFIADYFLVKLLARFGIGTGYTVIGQFPYFLGGLFLADLFADEWGGSLPAPHIRWDLLAVPGWLALPLFWEVPILPRSSLSPILWLLVYGSLRSVVVRSALRWPPIVITGGMCYSIYLLHMPILQWTSKAIGTRWLTSGLPSSLAVYGLVCLIPVTAASVLFFLLVEKPCMRRDWPSRLWSWISTRPPRPETTSP